MQLTLFLSARKLHENSTKNFRAHKKLNSIDNQLSSYTGTNARKFLMFLYWCIVQLFLSIRKEKS